MFAGPARLSEVRLHGVVRRDHAGYGTTLLAEVVSLITNGAKVRCSRLRAAVKAVRAWGGGDRLSAGQRADGCPGCDLRWGDSLRTPARIFLSPERSPLQAGSRTRPAHFSAFLGSPEAASTIWRPGC